MVSDRPAEVLSMLNAIDRGEITVDMVSEHGDSGATVHYSTSSGWHIEVFDDAGGWDYVERFRAPGSSEWVDPWDFTDAHGVVVSEWEPVCYWRPRNLTRWHWEQYGQSPSGYRIGPLLVVEVD